MDYYLWVPTSRSPHACGFLWSFTSHTQLVASKLSSAGLIAW